MQVSQALKIASLRDLISMVPQEPLLFSATVRENILYGRLDASPEDVEAAARASRAHGFVQELSARYETEVGERGVKLSVGQQQRISIARAFLKDAPILLLDEPTSALDLRTEADFLEGLSDLMAGRTVFIVAHRLSTIRNVDRIYFLEDRVIAEEGPHEADGAARPLLRPLHATVRLRRDRAGRSLSTNSVMLSRVGWKDGRAEGVSIWSATLQLSCCRAVEERWGGGREHLVRPEKCHAEPSGVEGAGVEGVSIWHMQPSTTVR
jgi:ABC-type multidrug transport system ATPase subunit